MDFLFQLLYLICVLCFAIIGVDSLGELYNLCLVGDYSKIINIILKVSIYAGLFLLSAFGFFFFLYKLV